MVGDSSLVGMEEDLEGIIAPTLMVMVDITTRGMVSVEGTLMEVGETMGGGIRIIISMEVAPTPIRTRMFQDITTAMETLSKEGEYFKSQKLVFPSSFL